MAKRKKASKKINIKQLCIAVAVVLLILLAGFFLWRYFFSGKANNYLIENNYYGFKLQTPKGWTAIGKTIYSQSNIDQIAEQCKNDGPEGAASHEMGAFRFESFRYPEDLASLENTTGDLNGFSSGVVLEISIDCINNKVQYGKNVPTDSFNVAGLSEVVNTGTTHEFSLVHNNLQYYITEHVYISLADKNKEATVRQDYAGVLNKIISGFQFIK